ncbi:MAG TPA: exopolysaccharide biosynthesis polyprenyl glycosylphosphotransferase [Streptosporangiaceae bacterium]|nr:exopolysaccharide biosynthesis polyprenyl glycosylphosphotransferase [Streptosporangiaceae bacterium]
MTNELPGATPAVVGRLRTGPEPRRLPRPVPAPGSALPPAAQGPGQARPGWASMVVPVVALPAADLAGLAAAGGVTRPDALTGLVYALVALIALSAGGLHRLRICLRVSDQAGRILAATLLPGLLLLPLLPAASAVRLALVSAGLVIAARLITCAVVRAAHRRGVLGEPTLIIGSGTFGAHLADQLREHAGLGLRVAGFLDAGRPRRDLAEPWLGRPEDLSRVITARRIRRVLICFSDSRDEELVEVLRACRGLPCDVCVVPRLYEVGLAVPRACLDEIWGIPLIPLRRMGHTPASMSFKRVFDVAVAAILLTVTLPLLAVLALVIRLQTGQPPLFRQRRVSGSGREVSVLKLRTITDSPHSDTTWAVDPRQCSRLGRLLRASHIDELPQLVNVLRGEMSLVGPRPERRYFAEQFGRQVPRYADRDRMRAGLTGWAQVHGLHGDTSIAERSRFDNQYIEYWSPWLDLMILLRTVGAALSGPGAGR